MRSLNQNGIVSTSYTIPSCQTQLGAGLEGAELAKEVDVGNCVVFGACVASGSMNGTVEVPVVVAGVEGL